jgi:RHS repeat-associated protein
VIEEYAANTVATQYLNGDRIDKAVTLIKGGVKYFYHQDRLGSVIALSNADGKIIERYDYGEYGKITIYNETGNKTDRSIVDNVVTYTGQRLDSETKLYYYKNRYYSASLGRFLSKDPFQMIDGPNQYSYLMNDPVKEPLKN